MYRHVRFFLPTYRNQIFLNSKHVNVLLHLSDTSIGKWAGPAFIQTAVEGIGHGDLLGLECWGEEEEQEGQKCGDGMHMG